MTHIASVKPICSLYTPFYRAFVAKKPSATTRIFGVREGLPAPRLSHYTFRICSPVFNTVPVEECDGADVINLNLGPAFPMGLLVVQDGDDDPKVLEEDDGELENIATSFRFVPWENIAQAFPTPCCVLRCGGAKLIWLDRLRR